MEAAFVIALGVLAVIIILLFRQMQQLQQAISQRVDANVQTVSSLTGTITSQLNSTTNIVGQVHDKLGQMQEASRQIFDLAKQMSSLQEILQSPKMRGGLGEFLLSDLLAQCLHAQSYRMQYPFKNGTMVDAALFIGKHTLCVDSKFPLENFRRLYQTESDVEKKNLRKQFLTDVKKHVNDIAAKYILPDEGTFDFALMFIPAENVYYELIIRDQSDLYEHCLSKRVVPVSPNSFYAYLQVIVQGLRGFQISQQAKDVLAQLQKIGNELDRLGIDFAKIGSHLRDAQSSFDRSDVRLEKLKKKVATMGSSDIEESEEDVISLPKTGV